MEYVLETYSSGNLLGKSLIENPGGDICHKTNFFQQSHEDILSKCKKYFLGISTKTPHLFWRYFVRRTLPNKLWRATVYQANFEWKYLPNKFQRKPLPKSIWKKHAYQKNLKRNLYKKNLKRKFSPSKKSNNFSTKNYLEKFNQENSEKTFPAKLKFEEQSLPKHLFQETFPYQINWRNISTKKNEETSPPKNPRKKTKQETWQKSELMKSDETTRLY